MTTSFPVHLGRVLIALALPVLLLTSSVLFVTGMTPFYRYAFEKYRVTDVTGLTNEQLVWAAQKMVMYLSSRSAVLSIDLEISGVQRSLLNQRETDHMRDVRDLFVLARGAQMGSGLLCLVVVGALLTWGGSAGRRAVASGFVWAGGLTLGLLVAAAIGTLFDFQGLFIRFHMMSFSNDLWQLDPRQDYLIMMFPLGFWMEATLIIVILSAVTAAAIYGVGWFLLGQVPPDSAADPLPVRPDDRRQTQPLP